MSYKDKHNTKTRKDSVVYLAHILFMQPLFAVLQQYFAAQKLGNLNWDLFCDCFDCDFLFLMIFDFFVCEGSFDFCFELICFWNDEVFCSNCEEKFTEVVSCWNWFGFSCMLYCGVGSNWDCVFGTIPFLTRIGFSFDPSVPSTPCVMSHIQ